MAESVPTQVTEGTSEPVTRKKRRAAIWIAVLSFAVAGFFILRQFDPNDSSFYPKCMLFQWTGLHCPGCGTTRALGALSHGRFWDAVRNNPLLILGGPAIFALIGFQRWRERGGRLASPRLAWTLFAILILYTIARNVPTPDRGWLAPPPVETQSNEMQNSDARI